MELSQFKKKKKKSLKIQGAWLVGKFIYIPTMPHSPTSGWYVLVMTQFCIWAVNSGMIFLDAVFSGSCLLRNFKIPRSLP